VGAGAIVMLVIEWASWPPVWLMEVITDPDVTTFETARS
jgi:hypothetical protein